MSVDYGKPLNTTGVGDWSTYLIDNIKAAASFNEDLTPTGVVANMKRYNSTDNIFEYWTGAAWAILPLTPPSYLTNSGTSISQLKLAGSGGAGNTNYFSIECNPSGFSARIGDYGGYRAYLVNGLWGFGAVPAPQTKVHILSSANTQLRLDYDGANYADLTTGADGTLYVASTFPRLALYDGTQSYFIDIHAGASVGIHLSSNGESYFNGTSIGIGFATTPAAKLHVISTTEQLRLGYDGSNYLSTTVGATGITTITPVGTAPSVALAEYPLYLVDSDVAHGMTSIAPTNCYGAFQVVNGLNGGLKIYGLSDTADASGLFLYGIVGSTLAAGYTAMSFLAGKANSTSWTSLLAAEEAFSWANYTTRLMTVLGNGNLGVNVSAPTYKLDVAGSSLYAVARISNAINTNDVNWGSLQVENTLAYALGNDARISFAAKESGGTTAPLASFGLIVEGSYQGGLGFNTRTTDLLWSEKMRLSAAGTLQFVNENVAHGITDLAPTNCYGQIRPAESSNGGIAIFGLTDAADSPAIYTYGIVQSTLAVGVAAASSYVGKKSGTSWAALLDAEEAYGWNNYTVRLMTLMGDGDLKVGSGLGATNLSVNHLGGAGGCYRIENAGTLTWIFGQMTSGTINNDFVIDETLDPAAPKFIIKADGKIGFGVAAPEKLIHAISTEAQIRLGYDATYYTDIQTSAAGLAYLRSSHQTVNGSGQYNVAIADATAMAQYTGAGIALMSKYATGGNETISGAMWSEKDNSTTGEYGFSLYLSARQNGADVLGDLMISSTGHTTLRGTLKVVSSTVAAAPSASTLGAGSIIYISNGAAGNPVLAFSDGTNWLRCDTLAAISAS